MKLTPKQNELIEEYKRLESKYGKGNVFLRYVNDFWRIRFIIHKIGEKIIYLFMIIRLMEELLIHWIEIIY